jgi:hypothetical protein
MYVINADARWRRAPSEREQGLMTMPGMSHVAPMGTRCTINSFWICCVALSSRFSRLLMFFDQPLSTSATAPGFEKRTMPAECRHGTRHLQCGSYLWLSNRVQISYSARQIGQLRPLGFSNERDVRRGRRQSPLIPSRLFLGCTRRHTTAAFPTLSYPACQIGDTLCPINGAARSPMNVVHMSARQRPLGPHSDQQVRVRTRRRGC